MIVITIASAALGVFLVLGFLLGLLRGWKKSVIRLGMVFGSALIALFLAPVIASTMITKFVSGLVLNAFGFTVDFEQIATEILGDSSFVGDLFAPDGTTTKLATALMNVIINIAMFIAIFLLLFLLTLIIYWIIALVVHVKKKNKDEEKEPIKFWERLIGGGVGIIGIMIIFFVFTTPLFGIIGVCDKFVKTTNDTSSAQAAVVYAESNSYYNDEDSMMVDDLFEEYSKISNAYKHSFAGIVFKYSGVDSCGRSSFEYLSDVTYQGLRLNFVKECSIAINVYGQYRQKFVNTKFDVKNNEQVEDVRALYIEAVKSEILKSYVTELVPKFCKNWSEGNKYFGMEYPVSGEFRDLTLSLLDAFNTTSFDSIDENVNVLLNTLKVANNDNVIASVQSGKEFTKIMKDEDTFIKDVIAELSTSQKFSQTLPKTFNCMIKLAYEKTIGNPGDKFNSDDLVSTNIVWNDEAQIMQDIVSGVFNIYEDKNNMIDHLAEIGKVIDSARRSRVISKPMKIFILDFIMSDNFNLNDTIKTSLYNSINDNWDITLHPNYKFETMLETVETTAKIAQNITTNLGSMNLESISDVLHVIVSDGAEGIKSTVKDILNDGNVMSELLGSGEKAEQNAEVFTDMLNSFLDNTSTETVKNDIAAGQAIVDLVHSSQNNKDGNEVRVDFSGYGDNGENGTAEDMVNLISSSDAIMNMLDKSTKDDSGTPVANSTIQEIASNLNSADKTAIETAIENMNPQSEQEILKQEILRRVFGL